MSRTDSSTDPIFGVDFCEGFREGVVDATCLDFEKLFEDLGIPIMSNEEISKVCDRIQSPSILNFGEYDVDDVVFVQPEPSCSDVGTSTNKRKRVETDSSSSTPVSKRGRNSNKKKTSKATKKSSTVSSKIHPTSQPPTPPPSLLSVDNDVVLPTTDGFALEENECFDEDFEDEDDGGDDGLWVQGTVPVSLLTDVERRTTNYGEYLYHTLLAALHEYGRRNPMSRNHDKALVASMSLFSYMHPVLSTYMQHKDALERFRVQVDNMMLPAPKSVSEKTHPLESVPCKRIENSVERLLREGNKINEITAQQILNDVGKRDSYSYHKSKNRFRSTFGSDSQLASTLTVQVVKDMTDVGIFKPGVYDTADKIEELFNEIEQYDRGIAIKVRGFVQDRCVQRHLWLKRNERNGESAKKDALKLLVDKYSFDFKNRVTCTDLKTLNVEKGKKTTKKSDKTVVVETVVEEGGN